MQSCVCWETFLHTDLNKYAGISRYFAPESCKKHSATFSLLVGAIGGRPERAALTRMLLLKSVLFYKKNEQED